MFSLHPQLERDTFFVSDMDLCRVLLMNNSLFPWLILVPRVDGAREITDLCEARQRHTLMDEIALASQVMKNFFSADKLNVAALGNQVPQLHVHVIARFVSDSAWPQPVWGNGGKPYDDAKPIIKRLHNLLTN